MYCDKDLQSMVMVLLEFIVLHGSNRSVMTVLEEAIHRYVFTNLVT